MRIEKLKDMAIYGAGGYGKEVAGLINAINKKSPQWNLIGFFDDGLPIGHENEYGKVLGGIKELNEYANPLSIVMAIARPQTLKNIVEKITAFAVDFPNIIAPDILFFDIGNVEIGFGNIIGFRCGISCNVKIGNFNRLNYNVTLGHDDVIGNYNMFNPSVRISGEVIMGDCNFIGVGSIVLQQIKIGNTCASGLRKFSFLSKYHFFLI